MKVYCNDCTFCENKNDDGLDEAFGFECTPFVSEEEVEEKVPWYSEEKTFVSYDNQYARKRLCQDRNAKNDCFHYRRKWWKVWKPYKYVLEIFLKMEEEDERQTFCYFSGTG